MKHDPTPDHHRAFLVCLLLAALLAGAFYFARHTFFEQRNTAEYYASQTALENPLLATSRLLKQRGFKIKQVDVFDKVLSRHLPSGTLYLNDVGGDFEDEQFKDVMQWVERGNTLIYHPRDSGKSLELTPDQACEQKAAADDEDEDGYDDKSDDKSTNEVAPANKPKPRKPKLEDKPAIQPAPDSASAKAPAMVPSGDGSAGPPRPTQAGPGQSSGPGDDENGPAAGASSDTDAASNTENEASAAVSAEASAEATAETTPASAETASSTPDNAPESASKAKKKMLNADPISQELGLELRRLVVKLPDSAKTASAKAQARRDKKVLRPCLASLTWPQSKYALELSHRYALQSESEPGLLITDQDRHSVRVYQRGKGHIVALAQPYFTNGTLPHFDHAELLLHLVGLQKDAKNFTIVQQLKRQTWYQKLWNNFYLALITLGLGLILLLWINLRRFGSVLPMPEPNRRALLEHIDASSRWLWKMPGGREILLNAARASTLKILQRRAPAIMRLPEAEQIAQLSATCSINRPDLVLALSSAVAPTPLLFMRQIKTLQRLRKHYER